MRRLDWPDEPGWWWQIDPSGCEPTMPIEFVCKVTSGKKTEIVGRGPQLAVACTRGRFRNQNQCSLLSGELRVSSPMRDCSTANGYSRCQVSDG